MPKLTNQKGEWYQVMNFRNFIEPVQFTLEPSPILPGNKIHIIPQIDVRNYDYIRGMQNGRYSVINVPPVS